MEQVIKQRIADIQRGNLPAGYRKTKCGIIPDTWSCCQPKEIFSGKSIKNNDSELPVLSVTQENGVMLRSEMDKDISYKEDSVSSYKRVDIGDFVISLRSFEGGIEYSQCQGVVSPAYTIFSHSEDVDGNYYKYYFKTDFFIKKLNTAVYGIRDGKQIGFQDFSNLFIHCPPLEEQRRIADILGYCDRVIALKKELIAEKKKQKKALMQKLLNPDSDFRLPVIREKITQVHFNDICRFINGRAYSQDELLETGKYRVLRVGNLFTSDTWYFSNLELPNDKYCQKDDLLYAWSASFGPFIWQGETTIYHYHIWKVEPCEHVDKMFLYHCLKYDAELLENSIQGGTMSHITKETMERRLCPFVGNLDLQKNIADILSAADKEIDLLEQELSQQEQKKKSLMQLLLTGTVRG